MLVKLLIKLYMRKNRSIYKISYEDEMKLYLFNTPGDVTKIINANMTIQTMRYFEAETDEERWAAKGAALILKIMKDAHRFAGDNYNEGDEQKSFATWKIFKKQHRTN